MSQPKMSARLTLLPTERRQTDRVPAPPHEVKLVFSSGALQKGVIEESAFTHWSVRLAHEIANLNLGETIGVSVHQNSEIVINGQWKLTGKRSSGDGCLCTFQYPSAELIQPLKSKIPGEVLRRTNRHRCFDLTTPEGTQEVSQHVTEMRTCPVPISITVASAGETGVPADVGRLSFDSGRRELDSLEISGEGLVRFTPGQKVILEYTFLGVRYVAHTAVREVDADFGLLIADLPKLLVAITARQFDRFPCRKKVRLAGDGIPTGATATMADVCPSGASVVLDGDSGGLDAGTTLDLEFDDLPRPLRCMIAFRAGRRLGVSFRPETDQDREILRTLINSSLPDSLVLRNPGNYEFFWPLYKAAGYAPQDESFEEWAAETKRTWQLQDELLPGNYAGAQVNGSPVVCTGTMPVSTHVVVGHSWAMLKSLDAISQVSDLLAQQNTWIELLSGISHLAWCVRKESRFMGRLHFAYEFHARPDEQALFPSLAVLPGPPGGPATQPLSFEPAKAGDHETLPKELRDLVHRIGVPHPLLREIHEVEHFWLKEPGAEKPVAYLICSSTPERFTAIDLLKNIWCLLLDEKTDLLALCHSLRHDSRFKKHEIDLFSNPSGEPIEWNGGGSYQTLPILWYFVPKDDFASILPSIYRTIYAVLRKYGEEAVPYLSRVMGA